MRTSPRIAEASLLFAAPLSREIASETPELTRCLDSLGWPLETTYSAPGEVLFLNCGAVQITIAQSALPFAVDDFRGVARPGQDLARDVEALARLLAHQACATVLVGDSKTARSPARIEAKRRICWEVTDLIAEAMGAELVFWGENDVLYFSDEFARSSPGKACGPTGAKTGDERWRWDARDKDSFPKGPEAPDMPFTAEGPWLDFLHPLHEDRRERPDSACRIEIAIPEESAEADPFVADMAGAAVDPRQPRDVTALATLALVGLGLASVSVLTGLIPIQ